ncbi:MAG: Nif3-like dinuclear metal center hexameric protein [Bacteroidetes bacterium HGW-Bacteroidetes-6]|jgi:dinuclear metal center YbgI/SA1388 family protein|nr:MAG: Nif3-like dinuclear metal center hexameric protein [Bacteroidetes bacterium HGW-Bacteroidetes-6]
MKLLEIVNHLEKLVPSQLQENYDNCGLQIGNPENEIIGILYSLDINENVIDKAIDTKCNLIISHHPLIFTGVKNIDLSKPNGRIIQKCIQHQIAIVSLHTNFDKSPFGVNSVLANALGLIDTKTLVPESGKLKKIVTFCPVAQAETVRKALFNAGAGHIGNYDSCSFYTEGFGSFKAGENTNPFAGEAGRLHFEPEMRIETVFPAWKQKSVIDALLSHHPYEEVAFDVYSLDNSIENIGLGLVGNLIQPQTITEFLNSVKEKLNIQFLRFSQYEIKTVKRIAVCGGSGTSFISHAIASGAQAFITADAKYHDFQAASGRILLVDAGHFETEIFSLNALMSLVSDFLPNFAPQIIYPETNWVNTV